MTFHRLLLPLALAGVISAAPLPAVAETVRIGLHGFQEVPSISSDAEGSFRARISPGEDQIAYELSYHDLQGDVLQAHIHFGQRGVNGGVSVFLCQTATSADPTDLAPTCPASGSVQGVLQAANVIGPAGQGLSAGELAELIDAIRGGLAYVNVHSTAFPAGEVRGQLRGRGFPPGLLHGLLDGHGAHPDH